MGRTHRFTDLPRNSRRPRHAPFRAVAGRADTHGCSNLRLRPYSRGVNKPAVSTSASPPGLAVAVMGVPGAGKTTLAAALRASFEAEVFSAGDYLRRRAAEGDQVAASLLFAGRPLSTPAHQQLVDAALSAASESRRILVLDGSPRHVAQAEALAEAPCLIVGVALVIPEEAAYGRLAARAAGSGRIDDSPELSSARIHREARCLDALWDYFQAAGWPLARLDATVSEEVLSDMATIFLRSTLLAQSRLSAY